MRLTDFRALTFDCYGTLIDWERGIAAGLDASDPTREKPLTRDAVLEAHARHESCQQRYTPEMPYGSCSQSSSSGSQRNGALPYRWMRPLHTDAQVGQWPAFPDSASTLQYLKKYFKLIILSNVDNESFAEQQRDAASRLRRGHHGGGCRLL